MLQQAWNKYIKKREIWLLHIKYRVYFLSCASFSIGCCWSLHFHMAPGVHAANVNVLSACVLPLCESGKCHPKAERNDSHLIYFSCLINSCGPSLKTNISFHVFFFFLAKAFSMPLCCQIINYRVACSASVLLLRFRDCVGHWSNNKIGSHFPEAIQQQHELCYMRYYPTGSIHLSMDKL